VKDCLEIRASAMLLQRGGMHPGETAVCDLELHGRLRPAWPRDVPKGPERLHSPFQSIGLMLVLRKHKAPCLSSGRSLSPQGQGCRQQTEMNMQRKEQNKGGDTDASKRRQQDPFLPVSVLTIVPGTSGQFDLYLKRGESYVLYCQKGDIFSDEKLAKVLSVSEFFILSKEKGEYERYLAKNLGDLLGNEDVPIRERSRIFYSISSAVMKKAFDTKLPKGFSGKVYDDMMLIVKASIAFFRDANSLRSFSEFISHSYHAYSHSIQTMVLLISLLRHFPGTEKKFMQACAMGALLHDIGKTEVPVEVLGKPHDQLKEEEWNLLRTHPAKGIRICASLNLPQISNNCILFHHEQRDGNGYPGGLSGQEIPFEARALSVCNVYDALTTEQSNTRAVSPFGALTVMREDMQCAFDPEVFKRLVFVLGSAGLA